MSKSILIQRFCVLFTIIYILTVSILMKNVFATSMKNYKKMEILDDLPLKDGINDYVTQLEKLLNFVHKYKRYMDLNLGFALFLININLRTVTQVREAKIPENIKSRLENILKGNDELMTYFQDKSRKHVGNTEVESSALLITELFAEGEKRWEVHLKTFNTKLLKMTKFYSKKELTEMYSKWSKYVANVYDFEHYFPTTKLSDDCISKLMQIPVNPTTRWKHCNVSSSCVTFVHNGTDYGYALTHRLLYILAAQFSRGCTIISSVEDKLNIDKFCSKIYNELEYHSLHNFELPDLSLEMICLCTLNGHLQFLRRSWIEELLEFQNEIGCVASSVEGREKKLNLELYEVERPTWQLVDLEQDILGGSCNSHTTGVMGAVLSAAIRYLIEKYS